MKLKTLKDISKHSKNLVFRLELKKEAINWVKHRGLYPNQSETIEWIKHFFNITEEDLNA